MLLKEESSCGGLFNCGRMVGVAVGYTIPTTGTCTTIERGYFVAILSVTVGTTQGEGVGWR